MSTIEQAAEVDGDKLMQFVFRAVDEVGATLNAALVVLGDKLGLYRAMAGAGPLAPAELADRTGTAERYVREWLNAQAAGGYVEYDPASGRYTLPPEQTVALTDPDSPAYLPGFFQVAVGSVLDSPRIIEAARTGAGLGWHEHGSDVFDGCERFFRPGYNASLVSGMAARTGRCRRQAGGGGARRRHRLRPRLVHDPDGRRPSRSPPSSARTTTRARSRRPGSGRRAPGWRTGSASRSPRPRPTAAAGMTW